MRLIRQLRSRGSLKVQVPDLKYVFIQRDSGTDQKVTNHWSKVILADFQKNVEGETGFISIFGPHKVDVRQLEGKAETQNVYKVQTWSKQDNTLDAAATHFFSNQVSKHWTRHLSWCMTDRRTVALTKPVRLGQRKSICAGLCFSLNEEMLSSCDQTGSVAASTLRPPSFTSSILVYVTIRAALQQLHNPSKAAGLVWRSALYDSIKPECPGLLS